MTIKYDGYMAVLFVSDLDRSRAFYRDVMGLESPSGHSGNDAYFTFGPDGLLLIDSATADDLLGPANTDHEPARGARSVLVAPVPDVDAAYAELSSRGAEFIRPPEDRAWGLRCAHFKDPDGNVWEIHTPIEGS
jgi:lactoylglutathione lyase